MLSKLKKRFYAVKYVYSIQIERLEPWPCDDLPVCVSWKRGSKKSKSGITEPRFASNKDGVYPTVTNVLVMQPFDLSATLYSESSKTKLAGPYKRKDCVFSVLQMTSDGSVGQARLGTAILNLAEIAKCHEETKVQVTLSCDPKIKRAVGEPKLVLRCRVARSSNSTSFVPFPKTVHVNASPKNGVAKPATQSDLSSMSNEAGKAKKPGVLTLEQEISLEGFEGRTPPLDSIQEVLSPTASIKREENTSEQDPEGSESGKYSSPTEQSVLVVAGGSLTAITEEAPKKDETPGIVASEDIEDSAHSEENGDNFSVDCQSKVISKTSVHTRPKSDGDLDKSPMADDIIEPKMSLKTEQSLTISTDPELNVSHVAEIASILDSYWTTGRLFYSNAQPEKSSAKNESEDWWSMLVSLLTCMPVKTH